MVDGVCPPVGASADTVADTGNENVACQATFSGRRGQTPESPESAYCVNRKVQIIRMVGRKNGLRALRETYGDIVGDGAILYAGRDVYRFDANTPAIPWCAI